MEHDWVTIAGLAVWIATVLAIAVWIHTLPPDDDFNDFD